MELILPSLALKNNFVGVDLYTKKDTTDIIDDSIKYSYHAFIIGNIGILLPRNETNEVTEQLATCLLPNTNEVLFGMANLRGNIIPIFDMHAHFNIETKKDHNRKVLVIGKDAHAAAVLIDELPVTLAISQQDKCSVTPSLPKEIQQHLKNSYQIQDKIWIEVDLTSLFFKLSEFI
ncbi:hypothetical protein MNBD_GAMMA22-2317 [hydrothermal vent metagenome]|uniref:CheW-like domain-containing protein n=1 Tax=hydrothermal vent metagenome TaxID=652676 RepID=A0A3B0ZK37_9ZZZZ